MILCCGEALIDMIPSPTVNGADGFVPHAGGAVFNTAIALGRLGVRSGMIAGLSSDMFGQQLRTALGASHVDTSLIITSDRPTTLAFVQLVNGHATYSFFDENSAGRMLQPDDMPALPDHVQALYFGGISLACEPGADAYAALAAQHSRNHVVMIDPNIRPSFIRDEAAYRTRLTRMISGADIIKVSDEDLNWIIPGPGALADKAAQIRSQGPSMVILTCGVDGAHGFLPDGSDVHQPVNKVRVIDTVGAGDTFNAGILASLSEQGLLTKSALRGITIEQAQNALCFGAQIAAVTVSRAGANPPWRAELA